MEDSESFSSLADLIDSHLSKSNIQASESANRIHDMIKSSVEAGLSSSISDTNMLPPPSKTFNIPGLSINQSGRTASQILAEQVSNAVQAKKLAERQRLEEEEKNKNLREKQDVADDDFIDLMKCLQIPYNSAPVVRPQSPEMEDYPIDFLDYSDFEMPESEKKPINKLPCILKAGWSHNTKQKRRCNKSVSNMGRVLCTKYLERKEPYFEEIIPTEIQRFDFSTPSPDDIIRATLKKPFPIQPRIFK